MYNFIKYRGKNVGNNNPIYLTTQLYLQFSPLSCFLTWLSHYVLYVAVTQNLVCLKSQKPFSFPQRTPPPNLSI